MGKQFKFSSKLTAKFLVALLVLQAVMFSLTAFGADTTLEIGDSKKVPVAGPISVFTGSTTALTAVFTPTNSTYKASWSASTSKVTVSATGSVKATAVGSSVVTASLASPSLSDTITFNVYAAITKFSYQTAAFTILAGETLAMPEPAILLPSDVEVTTTTYAVTLPKTNQPISINNATGEITASESVYGAATVEVTKVYAGPGDVAKRTKKATFKVLVPTPVYKVEITSNGKTAAGDTLGVNLGAKTTLKTILNTGSKAKPTNTKIVWSSDNVLVPINASTGIIDLKSAPNSSKGQTATITATADDDRYTALDTIEVTVAAPLKAVTVTKSVYLLKVDDVKQIIPVLTSTIATLDPSVASVTYTSDKPATVTVDTYGVITGIATGTAKITVLVTALDGSTKKIIVTATVVADVTNIVLTSPTTALKPLKLYGKGQIKAVITPSGLKLNAVRYTSADPDIAFVNPYTGEVTATGVGTTTVTASADGVTSSAITIHVADPDGLQQ